MVADGHASSAGLFASRAQREIEAGTPGVQRSSDTRGARTQPERGATRAVNATFAECQLHASGCPAERRLARPEAVWRALAHVVELERERRVVPPTIRRHADASPSHAELG